MNGKRVKITIWLTLILLLAGLVACNYPTNATKAPPQAQYTQAAQTVDAQLTAMSSPATQVGNVSTPPVSPTPTHTSAPTATATLASTPTENLKLLFSDDFSSESGWYTSENDDFGFRFVDEQYMIYVNIPNANIWSIRDKNYTDVVLEVEAARSAGPEEGYYGLVCRQVDAKNFYGLVIRSNGSYGIGKMDDGEFTFLQEGQDANQVINPGAMVFNKLRADCVGDSLRLIVNGKKLVEVQDDRFSEGVTGLMAGTHIQTGLEILFDNFATYQP